jgi:hypothetical protein
MKQAHTKGGVHMGEVTKADVGERIGEILTEHADAIPDFEAGRLLGRAEGIAAAVPVSAAADEDEPGSGQAG